MKPFKFSTINKWMDDNQIYSTTVSAAIEALRNNGPWEEKFTELSQLNEIEFPLYRYEIIQDHTRHFIDREDQPYEYIGITLFINLHGKTIGYYKLVIDAEGEAIDDYVLSEDPYRLTIYNSEEDESEEME